MQRSKSETPTAPVSPDRTTEQPLAAASVPVERMSAPEPNAMTAVQRMPAATPTPTAKPTEAPPSGGRSDRPGVALPSTVRADAEPVPETSTPPVEASSLPVVATEPPSPSIESVTPTSDEPAAPAVSSEAPPSPTVDPVSALEAVQLESYTGSASGVTIQRIAGNDPPAVRRPPTIEPPAAEPSVVHPPATQAPAVQRVTDGAGIPPLADRAAESSLPLVPSVQRVPGHPTIAPDHVREAVAEPASVQPASDLSAGPAVPVDLWTPESISRPPVQAMSVNTAGDADSATTKVISAPAIAIRSRAAVQRQDSASATGSAIEPSAGGGTSDGPGPIAYQPPLVVSRRAVGSSEREHGPRPGEGVSFASMFGGFGPAAVDTSSAAEDGYTSVQLQSADGTPMGPGSRESEPTVQTAAAPEPPGPEPTAAAPSADGAAAVAAPAPAAGGNLDEMARRLYEPLVARLREELWLDRERAGAMSDL